MRFSAGLLFFGVFLLVMGFFLNLFGFVCSFFLLVVVNAIPVFLHTELGKQDHPLPNLRWFLPRSLYLASHFVLEVLPSQNFTDPQTPISAQPALAKKMSNYLNT